MTDTTNPISKKHYKYASDEDAKQNQIELQRQWKEKKSAYLIQYQK
jgi:hypothetical protein